MPASPTRCKSSILSKNSLHPGGRECAVFCAAIDDRIQLASGVDDTNTSVSGREALNGVTEPGRDLLETDVVDGAESARAKKSRNGRRLETAGRPFIHLFQLLGPLRF